MKGLLRSQKFRSKLYKWLFMYVGVMALFATVITYSKYISSFDGNDEARTAKFYAQIDYLGCQSKNESNGSCDAGTFRKTSPIEYRFAVNTTNFEVTTDFALTFIVDSTNFKITKLLDESNNKELDISNVIDGKISVPDTIKDGVSQNTKKKISNYTLTVEYIGNNSLTKEYKDIVKVGYSAEQQKNK